MASEQQDRKAALLAAFVRYLLRNGVNAVSLRPAAAALGTSPRMLIYYFGSREQLLFEAMDQIRGQERERFVREIQQRPPTATTTEFFVESWRWYASKRREPYLRLLFELYGLAFMNPRRYGRFLRAMAEDYFLMIEEGLRSQGFSPPESRIAATLYRATIRGLLMDVLSTGERERVEAAVTELARNLERDLAARAAAAQADRPRPTSDGGDP